MRIGNKEFKTQEKTYVMGILNSTPDSFSDGGKWNQLDAALFHVEQMIKEGCDILDIGGESTRPGHEEISAQEEMSRVLPLIRAVTKRFDIPVSLDTWKAEVAREGIREGVHFMNDIWGLKKDPDMAAVIAEADLPCCLMHNRSNAEYQDFWKDMTEDLKESILLARQAGISDENIILDPGVGFAKTYQQNLEVVNRLEQLHALGYPLLLGTSRKSMIGLTLNLPVDQRLEGTLVTTVFAVMKKCLFVRVHDILENVRAIKMAEALLYETGA